MRVELRNINARFPITEEHYGSPWAYYKNNYAKHSVPFTCVFLLKSSRKMSLGNSLGLKAKSTTHVKTTREDCFINTHQHYNPLHNFTQTMTCYVGQQTTCSMVTPFNYYDSFRQIR